MDHAIESLKSQISNSKEQIKSLAASTSFPVNCSDAALTALTTSLQTADIQARITELENEVPRDPWFGFDCRLPILKKLLVQ